MKIGFCAAAAFFICAVLCPVAGAGAQNGWALDTQTLNAISALPDNQFSFNDILLSISEKACHDLYDDVCDIGGARKLLGDMAAQAAKKIGDAKAPQDIIAAITDTIFNEYSFGVDRSRLFEGSIPELLLPVVLEKRKGNCLSLSLVYLLLAERLDVPLSGVMIPRHFFVRYEDGDTRINIETTDRGRIVGLDYYFSKFHLSSYDSAPLRSLQNNKEVLAVYLSDLSTQYKLQGDHIAAIEILQSTIAVLPKSASLYVNLGNAYERGGEIRQAIQQYRKALSLDPLLCEAHYNLGLIHFLYTKKFSAARRYGATARKLGCRLHPKFKAFLDKGEEER